MSKVFRVTGINIPPSIVWEPDEDGELKPKGLISFSVGSTINIIKRKFNFTKVLITVDGEHDVGHESSPGNWTSSTGMLARKEADMFGGQYYITPEVDPFVNFATAFDGTEFSVLSGPPRKLFSESPSIFSSVDRDTWIFLAVFWLIVCTVYYVMSNVERAMHPEVEKISLAECTLNFYGLLFQRGFDKLPLTLSRRILATGWLFMVFILTIELSGALSSKLAVKEVPERIDRIQDILNYAPQGSGLDTYLAFSEEPDLKAVWNQVLRYDGYCGYDEYSTGRIMGPIKEGRAVALGAMRGHLLPPINVACKQEFSHFYVGKEPFLSTYWSYMVRKDLDPKILETVSQFITLLGGMGFPTDLWNRMGKYADPCMRIEEAQISYSPTALSGIAGVFKVLGVGVSASTLAFIIEILSTKLAFRKGTES